MDKDKMSRYYALAEVLKAITHPARLIIIEELSQKERCVSELTEIIGLDTSTVSKHLALMKNAGIVANDRIGNQVFYNLRVPCILQFIGCIESVILDEAEEKLRIIKCN